MELRNTNKELNIANHQLQTKHEEAVAENKKIKEQHLTSQMMESPLLAQSFQRQQQESAFGGFEEDDKEDGWGSPEPEKSKKSEADAIEVETIQEAESDGWGGWGDDVKVDEDEIKLDDDGLKNVDTEQEVGKNLVEREADIEDGWGDDSWGGFGDESMSGAMEENLAENLRGFENEEDGLDAQRSIEDGKELDRIVSQLESKVVEKESVIESLENDLKTLKTRFEAANEELKLLEEEKEELEQQLDTC